MDIMDKIAPGNAMLHVLVVTKLTDCVIMAVIQDGRGITVNNVMIYIFNWMSIVGKIYKEQKRKH